MVLAVKKQSSSSSSRLQYPLLMLLSTVMGPHPSLSSSDRTVGQGLCEGPFWLCAQMPLLVGYQAAFGQAVCLCFLHWGFKLLPSLGPLGSHTLLSSAPSAALSFVPACWLPAPLC